MVPAVADHRGSTLSSFVSVSVLGVTCHQCHVVVGVVVMQRSRSRSM